MLKQLITLSVLYAVHAAHVIADDIEIYQAGDQGTRPNVMFLLDTSGSMEGTQEIVGNRGAYDPDILYHGPFRSDRYYYQEHNTTLRYWTTGEKHNILDHSSSIIVQGVRKLHRYDLLDSYIPIDSFKCQSLNGELELNGYVSDQFLQWNPDREYLAGHRYAFQSFEADSNRQGYWERLRAKSNEEYQNQSNPNLQRYVDCRADMEQTPPSGLADGDGEYMTHQLFQQPYSLDENIKIINEARIPMSLLVSSATNSRARPELINRGDWGSTSALGFGGSTETIFTANYLNYAFYRDGDKNKPARLYVMGDAIAEAVGNNPGVNVGLARFDGSYFSADNLNGGMITIPMSDSEDSFQLFQNTTRDMDPYGGTPLSESYYEVAQFMRGHAPVFGNDTRVYQRRDFPTLPKDRPSIAESRVGNDPTGIYKSPIVDACQGNHIIVFSDGKATADSNANAAINTEIAGYSDMPSLLTDCSGNGGCAPSLAFHLANHDQIDNTILDNDQVIRTHAIGGFIPADERVVANKILKDMSETHGQGVFKEVDNEAEAQAALAEIFGGILATTISASAPAVSVNAFNRFELSDELYYAVFKPSSNLKWQGNLKRYRLGFANNTAAVLDVRNQPAINNNTGLFKVGSQSFWTPNSEGPDSAIVTEGGIAKRLSSSRVIKTSVDSTTDSTNLVALTTASATQANLNISDPVLHATLIDWANGIDVNDRDGDGDFTDARTFMEDPLHSEPTMLTYSKDSTNNTSDRAIFIGTNSGYVHSFDISTTTPKENFAFIPKELLHNLDKYYSGGSIHEHKAYGVDGPLTHWHQDMNGNGQVDAADGDKVYLYITLRRGGQSIYALDVTDKDSPTLAWQRHGDYPAGIPNRPTLSPGFENLGQTWARLEPATIAWNNQPRAVVITAGGYDPAEDGDTANNDLIGPLGREDRTLGTTIYIMDAATGELLWDAKTHTTLPPGLSMTSSFAAHVSPIDSTGDGLANIIYAPDVGGRIWRFDIKQAGIPTPSATVATISSDFATARLVADIYSDVSAPADSIFPASYKPGNRRFFNEIDVIYQRDTDEAWLSVGSGYRAHPKIRQVTNYHFIIRDKLEHVAPPLPTTFDDLEDWGISNDYGWKIPLSAVGEKVLSKSNTIGNQILFSTYAPTPVTSSVDCNPNNGEARLYVLNSHSGTSVVIPLQPKGIPPAPVLVTPPRDPNDTSPYTLTNRRIILIGTEIVTDDSGNAVEVGNEHDNINKDYWLEAE